jgi:predicted ATP-grasp superfamily ATP-dependent carboligase
VTHLRWQNPPDVDRPVLIAAFAGWNDAGDAATTAAEYLIRRWGESLVASIDPDAFYDFTTHRPVITLVDGNERELRWPENDLMLVRPDGGPPLVVLNGIEPHLRWGTFTDAVLEVARRLDCRMVVTLGALLAEVHHHHPVSVVGTSSDLELAETLGLQPSSYEGPTGIVGVLQHAAREAGFDAVSLWAAVPTYVPNATSPKAALALLQRAVELLGIEFAATDLQIAASDYERQVSTLLEQDEEAAQYAASIEEALADPDMEVDEGTGEELIEELEQFLRDQD